MRLIDTDDSIGEKTVDGTQVESNSCLKNAGSQSSTPLEVQVPALVDQRGSSDLIVDSDHSGSYRLERSRYFHSDGTPLSSRKALGYSLLPINRPHQVRYAVVMDSAALESGSANDASDQKRNEHNRSEYASSVADKAIATVAGPPISPSTKARSIQIRPRISSGNYWDGGVPSSAVTPASEMGYGDRNIASSPAAVVRKAVGSGKYQNSYCISSSRLGSKTARQISSSRSRGSNRGWCIEGRPHQTDRRESIDSTDSVQSKDSNEDGLSGTSG